MGVERSATWAGRAVLVTGGTGFIGLNLVDRLVAQGASVAVFARRGPAPGTTPERFRQARLLEGDIRDAVAVERAMQDVAPEVVFHLASTPFNPPVTSEREHHEVIAGGTANVLAALGMAPGARLVHVGSGAEYGSGSMLAEDAPLEPRTALGAAKAAATRLVRRRVGEGAVDAVVLRLFTPYGPWDHATRLIMHSALLASEGKDVPISDGRQQRDFVYIDDVVDALLRAGAQPVPSGSIFNICSGRALTVREVVEIVLAVTGSPGRALPGALPTRPDEIWELSGSNDTAATALGWRPETVFRDGVGRTCAWIRERGPLFGMRPAVARQ